MQASALPELGLGKSYPRRITVDVWMLIVYTYLPRVHFAPFRLVCRSFDALITTRCAFWHGKLSSASLCDSFLATDDSDEASSYDEDAQRSPPSTSRAMQARPASISVLGALIPSGRRARPPKLTKCLVHQIVSRVDNGRLLHLALRDARCQKGCCHAAWKREHLAQSELNLEQLSEDFEEVACAAIMQCVMFPRVGPSVSPAARVEDFHRVRVGFILVISLTLILVITSLTVVLVMEINASNTLVAPAAQLYWKIVLSSVSSASADPLGASPALASSYAALADETSLLTSTFVPFWVMMPLYYALLFRSMCWSHAEVVVVAVLESLACQLSTALIAVYCIDSWTASFTSCMIPSMIGSAWLFTSTMLDLKQRLQAEGRKAYARSGTLLGLTTCRVLFYASVLVLTLVVSQHLDDAFDSANRVPQILSEFTGVATPAPPATTLAPTPASNSPAPTPTGIRLDFSLTTVGPAYRLSIASQSLFSSVACVVPFGLACSSAIGILVIAMYRLGPHDVLEEAPVVMATVGGYVIGIAVFLVLAVASCARSLTSISSSLSPTNSAASVLSSLSIPQAPTTVDIALVLCVVVLFGLSTCANACASYLQTIIPVQNRGYVSGRLFL
jgi:hypothetical protein